MRFAPRLMFVLAVSSALVLAGCSSPGAPVPSRSVKSGSKVVSAKPDLMPAWTDKSAAKLALTGFVERSLVRGERGYVPPEDRVAVVSAAFLSGTADLAPLRQAVAYLGSNGYRVYLVSDVDGASLRGPAAERLGLSERQVIGAYAEADYVVRGGRPLVLPRADARRTAKPVVIDHALGGRRPVLALGAEASDVAMLEYTTLANPLPSAAFFVPTGVDGDAAKLRAEAKARGWMLVEPAADWAGDKR